MIVREIHSKSILNPSKVTKYCVNPYLGCQHGCVYCYATFMCKYGGHVGEKWGSFVDVKVNAPEVLEKELGKSEKGLIWMSSVTDPYQPVERSYGITRRILEKILEYDFPLFVQSKSSLMQRDIGLLGKMKDVEAGVSLVYANDSDRKNFEPFTSPVHERLETIKKLSQNGIRTFVFVGPFLPGISDRDLDKLISEIAEAGTDYIFLDKLNIKGGNWGRIKPVLLKHYPGFVKKYEKILFSNDDYFKKIKAKVKVLCRENSLDVKVCY
jgi:DNA repair photolyase